MSQTMDIKNVVVKIEERSDLHRRAKLAGIVRGAGSLGIGSAGVSFTVSTENLQLIKKTEKLLSRLYSVRAATREESSNLHSAIYESQVDAPAAGGILRDLLVLDGEGGIISDFTACVEFSDPQFVINFVSGVFLACGSVYLPDENRSGYHLEFVFSGEDTADNFAHILAELNFMPKKVARKSNFVIYLKESEAISDFFALIGAGSVVLKLQDVKAEREVRNLANRQSNCISANIDKALDAAENQLRAIEIIDSAIGTDNLPETLRTAAELRRAHPEESLSELSERGGISKSALNHRFRKLTGIANELGGKE